MGLLGELGKGQGYLRAGLLGFQSSGKTHTAMLIALGLRKHFGLKGRIAMFDTEGGSEYINDRVVQATGQSLLGIKSQTFDHLLSAGSECLVSNVDILIVDSVTHIWRELCESYLVQVNKYRAKKNLSPRTKLEFQDWGPIKSKWAEWTMFFLNKPLHMIICGRAGFEYDQEVNEETGKKELIKTGTKMKTEAEFGFEPSLLIEMERLEVPDGKGGYKVVHRATINKDRFDVMDGKVCDDPTFEFFLPHVSRLKPGSHVPILNDHTEMTVDEQGRGEWERLKLRRQKAWEEIENGLALVYPASTGKDKQAKLLIYQALLGTVSETKMQGLPPEQLELAALAVHQLAQDIMSGLQIEDVSAYARSIHEGIVKQQQDRMAPAPESVLVSGATTEPAAAPAVEEPAGTMDPWLSSALDCEDVLRGSKGGAVALATLRKGYRLIDGAYPMLAEERAVYMKDLKQLVERVNLQEKNLAKV